MKEEVHLLQAKGVQPGLAVVIVGDDPASRIYVNNKKKACAATDIYSEEYALPASTTQEELLELIHTLNEKPEIHGILVQSPLPKGLDEGLVVEHIDPKKDVDAFHAYNVGEDHAGEVHLPALHPRRGHRAHPLHRGGDQREAVRGHRPQRHCGQAHGHAVAAQQRHSDHLPQPHPRTCPPSAGRLTSWCPPWGRLTSSPRTWVKPGAVVIDVGMNRDENGKLCGDVDFAAVEPIASYITPVPGGVGPMTIAMLLKNTVAAAKLQRGL